MTFRMYSKLTASSDPGGGFVLKLPPGDDISGAADRELEAGMDGPGADLAESSEDRGWSVPVPLDPVVAARFDAE
jgi:hypothetical protein